ncbi:hypothetical protein NQ314_004148, partial [Rhamnusium bicolor]
IITNAPFLFAVCSSKTLGITTTHHDKPEQSSILKMATKMNDPEQIINITLSSSERQKRLLPYENFYLTQSFNQVQDQPLYEPTGQGQRYQFDNPPSQKTNPQYNDLTYQQNHVPNQDILYQTNNKFTPFLESNAIPGPFRPMIHSRQPQRIRVQYVSLPRSPQTKVPDFSAIYDKLAQLKLQNSRRPTYVQTYRPIEPQRYILKPRVNYAPQLDKYKTIQPTKTIIETFTATNIDIPNAHEQDQYNPLEPVQHLQVTPAKSYENDVTFYKTFEDNTKPYVNQQIAIEIPHGSYPQQNYEPLVEQKLHHRQKQIVRKPYIILQARPEEQREDLQPTAIQKPIMVMQRKPVYRNKPISLANNEEKFIPVPVAYVTEAPKYEPHYSAAPNYEPQYVTPKYDYQTVQPLTEPSMHVPTENSNSLGLILKQLQATNTLPQTLTPDNIDNSIKTLVKILEVLKKKQKFSKPIVVVQDVPEDYNEDVENEAGVGQVGDVPDVISEHFPADTPEGGTPGKPGVDYPALSSIPQTSFNCKTQRYKGFFGDPDTNCQVWHYCDLNGGQASFLCPNGTIFSQVALTCDWWYNVKCSSTAQLYVLNERLYKYIIPLSPKFPEDYSGPLVDKYLALKFQEMEEKMRKEKKGKGNASKEKESEELQDIETEEEIKTTEREREATTFTHQKETLETIEDANEQK